MFGGRNKKSEFPIGLDVGDGGVRMLQLATKGGAEHAIAAAYATLPDDLRPDSAGYGDALSAAIQSAFSHGGFSGNRVVSALPVSAVQCKNLRLPMMPANELASAVQWEAADRFRMGEGQCSVQYMHAGQVNQGDEVRQELILLASKLSVVESHVAALTANSLRPVAIDAVPCALARLSAMKRALSCETRDASAVDVTLDIGQSSTKVLIALDGQVRFYKPIEIGGASFESVLSGAMSISLDESRDLLRALDSSVAAEENGSDNQSGDEKTRAAVLKALRSTLGELAREIGLCLRYYGVTFRGARPAQAALVGGAATPWLASALSESTGLTLSLDTPLGGIDLSPVRDTVRPGSEGAWAVAAGLSIRQHMKHFAIKPEASDSEEGSVFDQTPRSQEVAA